MIHKHMHVSIHSYEMLDSITDSMDMRLSKLQAVKDREAWRATFHRVAKSWTILSN